jgi:hypothetical protein
MNFVPIPDSRESEDRTFAATARDTEAVVQITGAFSLTWRALLQRKRMFGSGSKFELLKSRERGENSPKANWQFFITSFNPGQIMTITSLRRISVAQEFVRIGFGDAIDGDAPFYSHEFLTQELTTTEVQAVLPIVKQYNNFKGDRIAAAIERFKGKVSGWKFGAAQSPILMVVLAPWSHQIEDVKPGGKSGTKFSTDERETLIAQLRRVFLDELDADKFERDGENEYVYGAWWD